MEVRAISGRECPGSPLRGSHSLSLSEPCMVAGVGGVRVVPGQRCHPHSHSLSLTLTVSLSLSLSEPSEGRLAPLAVVKQLSMPAALERLRHTPDSQAQIMAWLEPCFRKNSMESQAIPSSLGSGRWKGGALPQCIYQSVLDIHPPHKPVNPIF